MRFCCIITIIIILKLFVILFWQMSGMLLDGDRTSGQDVRTQNVTAAMAIANIVKSSLGPVGLDKMLVDEIGDVTITNDGATILAQLAIEHPAAKVLVELAQLQDQEVGDGTTSVVIVAAELLKRANELVKKGIHPLWSWQDTDWRARKQ